MKDKLKTPKWRLILKRLKYVLFQKRPIPLLIRKTCKSCGIKWNPELFRGCPLCGRGDKRVWVLLLDGAIKKVYDDPDKAKYDKSIIENEIENAKTEIQWWDIE